MAGAYAAVLAACFLPDLSVEDIVRISIEHTRDDRHVKEIRAMVELGRHCATCEEFIERYYQEILGHLIPFRDVQHEHIPTVSITWNSSEILGPVLAMFLITKGEDARTLLLACSKMGRDCDTITRCAGGLIGAYRGAQMLPAEWAEVVLAHNSWLRLEEKAKQLCALVRKKIQQNIATGQRLLQEEQERGGRAER